MYPFDLNTPFSLKIDEIQSNEFVYFKPERDKDFGDKKFNSAIELISKKTNRLFLSIDQLTDLENIKNYESNNSITWFGVPVTVGSDQNEIEKNQSSYSNIDSLSFKIFEELRSNFDHNYKVIPEFILSKNHYQLGPTIIEFFKYYKVPFAFLKIDGPPENQKIQFFRETFESLRINGFKGKIYFSFTNPYLDEWNIKTHNTFSGVQTVHIDLSNKCTHSCVFCGLWGPEFIDELKAQTTSGVLAQDVVSFMNKQMPFEKSIEILESLPETIKSVQFGGAGDPLTHPHWLEILSKWRSRGLRLEVLTNFEYPNFNEIESLHKMSIGRRKIDFMVNVSAASFEVYKMIRPRQAKETFEKVIENIRYANKLKLRDGYGMTFTMVHIINSLNFKEAVKMVELASDLGADVWLKPLEVHSDIHKKYSIHKDNYPLFKEMMNQALKRADELKVRIVLRDLIEAIVVS